MAFLTNLKGCGRKQYHEGVCNNYQGLLFMNNGKQQKLFFRSTEERESYYKKYLQDNKEYSNFKRYSVCSSTPSTQKQRRCGRHKHTTRKSKRKSKRAI